MMNLDDPITLIGMAVVVVLIIIFDRMILGAFSGLVKAMFTGWMNWVVIIIVVVLMANGCWPW